MKKIAVEKAHNRVERATAAFDRIAHSDNFASFAEAWTDFLLAANSVFSILEKGAKESPHSRQWYGGKKKQGRDDELVRYMAQARNADEHGIEPVVEHDPGYFAIGDPGEHVVIQGLTANSSGISGTLIPVDGKYPTITIKPAHPKLIPVFDDRFGGQWFDPPTMHLGQKLSDVSPLAAAEMMLKYVSDLVEEAQRYVR
jgi:hypothetical protein